VVPASFLVYGFVRGTWKTERRRGKATLLIKPFQLLAKNDRDALGEEGERLVRFMAVPEVVQTFEIWFADPMEAIRFRTGAALVERRYGWRGWRGWRGWLGRGRG
jgi:hypothetical protein